MPSRVAFWKRSGGVRPMVWGGAAHYHVFVPARARKLSIESMHDKGKVPVQLRMRWAGIIVIVTATPHACMMYVVQVNLKEVKWPAGWSCEYGIRDKVGIGGGRRYSLQGTHGRWEQ